MIPTTLIRIAKKTTSDRTLFIEAICIIWERVCTATTIGSVYPTKTTTIISTKWTIRLPESICPRAFRTPMIICTPVPSLHPRTIEMIIDTPVRFVELCLIHSMILQNTFEVIIVWTMLRILLVKFAIR